MSDETLGLVADKSAPAYRPSADDTDLDRARGARDDLRALASKVAGPRAHYASIAAFSVGQTHDDARGEEIRFASMVHAYCNAAALIAHAFGIPESREDDPPESLSWRLLDDEGKALRAEVQGERRQPRSAGEPAGSTNPNPASNPGEEKPE